MIGEVLDTSPERSMSFSQEDPDMTMNCHPKLSLGRKQIEFIPQSLLAINILKHYVTIISGNYFLL